MKICLWVIQVVFNSSYLRALLIASFSVLGFLIDQLTQIQKLHAVVDELVSGTKNVVCYSSHLMMRDQA